MRESACKREREGEREKAYACVREREREKEKRERAEPKGRREPREVATQPARTHRSSSSTCEEQRNRVSRYPLCAALRVAPVARRKKAAKIDRKKRGASDGPCPLEHGFPDGSLGGRTKITDRERERKDRGERRRREITSTALR